VTRLRATALELAAFLALAWYATAHWTGGLVADAPAGRAFACLVVAVAVGIALAVSALVRGVRGALLRCATVAAGIGAGLVAIGVDRRLLAPGRWDDLADGLDRGFAALGSVQWPYDGQEPWAALVLLLAVPIVVVAAAALAFWPNRPLRPAGLVLLVALYGVAVTEHRFDGELGRGMGLLLLVAAWLWLPRVPEQGWRTAAVAAGAVLAACVVALPAAARYDDREAWVDYESWNPFAAEAATSFDWSHSYGPIDWPRDGTTLMNVRSDERHYWKVETLDEFNGIRWVPSVAGGGNRPILAYPTRDDWETSFRVTIRDLETERLPVAGTARAVESDEGVRILDDGTAAVDSPLDEGAAYSVRAYVPDPTPEEMRASPHVPEGVFPHTTAILLPGGHPATAADIRASPYAGVLGLAVRLARRQPTTYDVVRAVQRYLRSDNFIYTERPQRRNFPLAAFLLEDRVGYCQHFSGAMALMLRMLGIPARVAAGFTPGSYNRDTREYRVRDLDAHSWVEVWFAGIGWVPFDPTPSIAPADSQSSAEAASASGGTADAGETQDPGGRQADSAVSGAAGDSARDDGEDPVLAPWMVVAALALATGLALGGLRLRAVLRRRRRAWDDEADIASLQRALARIGEPAPPRLTLRQLERRLERAAGAPAARYVRILRERRYTAHGTGPPDAAARRDLRRALARGRGLRGRLAALTVLRPAFRRG
jgi:transglutaminase-like putative cysteine protease